ncbi:uncharacterized protein [Bemisia tabaci]|uniref:uncharacterized protein n=1 Tax=Bemisia tabaci TaxID=7038 RepID=UPI003B28D17B
MENHAIWLAAVGVRRTLSKSTPHRCCEDHFNLETDLKDKFKLKKGILPHINIPNNTAEVLLPTCDSNASPQIVAKTDDHQILQIHDRPNSPRISNFSDETEIEASHQQLNATSASTFSHKPVAKASHQQLFAASMSTCSHDSVARSSHQQQPSNIEQKPCSLCGCKGLCSAYRASTIDKTTHQPSLQIFPRRKAANCWFLLTNLNVLMLKGIRQQNFNSYFWTKKTAFPNFKIQNFNKIFADLLTLVTISF